MTSHIVGEAKFLLDALGLSRTSKAVLEAYVLVDFPTQTETFPPENGVTIDYVIAKDGGAEFLYRDDSLSAVIVYLAAHGGYRPYATPQLLIEGLELPATRQAVLSFFGEPERSGPAWDRFAVDGGLLRFGFDSDGSTNMMTAMAAAPR